MVTRGNNADFQKAHDSGDTDFEPDSMHHTLGSSYLQAAPGNHGHPDIIQSIEATLEPRIKLHLASSPSIAPSTVVKINTWGPQVPAINPALPGCAPWTALTGANLGTYLVPKDGFYVVDVQISWVANATGNTRVVIFDINNVQVKQGNVLPLGGTDLSTVAIHWEGNCSVNDQIQVRVLHRANINVAMRTEDELTELTMRRRGPKW